MLDDTKPSCDLFSKEPWLLFHPNTSGLDRTKGRADFRQLVGNVMPWSKDSVTQSTARQEMDRASFWALGSLLGLSLSRL